MMLVDGKRENTYQKGALTIPEWLRVFLRSGASDVRVGLRRFFLLMLKTSF